MTTDDYYNAAPADRDHMVTEARARIAPPAAHTHRKPVILTAQMIFANRKRDQKRTAPPTHRGEPRPTLDELRTVNANLGRAHA